MILPSLLRLVAVVLLLGAGGCVRTAIREHVAATDFHGELKRIFVLNTLDQAFAAGLPTDFATAVQAELARCGVSSVIYRPDAMQLDAEAKLHGELQNFRPDAVLTMRFAVQSRYNGDVRAGTYLLRLQDVAEKRDIWRAEMTLASSASFLTDRSSAGVMFADRMVRQMAADAVLTGCPPVAPEKA